MQETPATLPDRVAADRFRFGTTLRMLAALAVLTSVPAYALEAVVPIVDLSGLPALPDGAHDENPYRGNPLAVEIGRSAYAQACARCHGEEASTMGPAADLRLLGRYCNRIADPTLRGRCVRDADFYFLKTVREGKLRLGIRHMPAWGDRLAQPLAWSIQAFIEARRR